MRFGKLVQPANNFGDQPAGRGVCDIFSWTVASILTVSFSIDSPCNPILVWNIFLSPSLPMRLRKCTNSVLMGTAISVETLSCHKKPGSKDYALPLQYNRLITQVLQLLEQQQSNH